MLELLNIYSKQQPTYVLLKIKLSGVALGIYALNYWACLDSLV